MTDNTYPENYTSIRFEVAQGAIGILLGHVSGLVAQEESKDVPDPRRLSELSEELDSLHAARNALPANDSIAIEAAIERYSSKAKEISAMFGSV